MKKSQQEIWEKGKKLLHKEVEKFMETQREYMEKNPGDYEGCKPKDFITWFAENF